MTTLNTASIAALKANGISDALIARLQENLHRQEQRQDTP